MDAAAIMALGQYVVLPICIAAGVIALFYFISK